MWLLVLGHREHTIALEFFEKGILGTTLHYDYEVRPEKDYFSSIPTPDVWARLSKVRLGVASGQAGGVPSVRFRPLARCYPNLLYCPIASVFTGAYIDNTFGSFYFCSTFNNASSIFLSD